MWLKPEYETEETEEKTEKNRNKYCQTDVGQRAHSGVQIFYEVASL